jgi:hypothetical protein
MDVPGKWIDRVRQRRALDNLILDLNSSASQTYGRRERPASPATKHQSEERVASFVVRVHAIVRLQCKDHDRHFVPDGV